VAPLPGTTQRDPASFRNEARKKNNPLRAGFFWPVVGVDADDATSQRMPRAQHDDVLRYFRNAGLTSPPVGE
jgi:hypothetical protein